METLYERTELLLGTEKIEKLKASRVLVVGLGGVGGFIAESLARSGVGRIGLCDFDVVDPTNLNRQILATVDKIGLKKTDVAESRLRHINPDIAINKYDFRLTEGNVSEFQIEAGAWDFVADAIDDTAAKLVLIEACYKAKTPIISSMGTGNKLDPFSYKIAPIEKTEVDPLARSMRKKLKEKGIEKLPVLFSTEPPVVQPQVNGEPIPSISYMPAIAGLEISSYIIQKITCK